MVPFRPPEVASLAYQNASQPPNIPPGGWRTIWYARNRQYEHARSVGKGSISRGGKSRSLQKQVDAGPALGGSNPENRGRTGHDISSFWSMDEDAHYPDPVWRKKLRSENWMPSIDLKMSSMGGSFQCSCSWWWLFLLTQSLVPLSFCLVCSTYGHTGHLQETDSIWLQCTLWKWWHHVPNWRPIISLWLGLCSNDVLGLPRDKRMLLPACLFSLPVLTALGMSFLATDWVWNTPLNAIAYHRWKCIDNHFKKRIPLPLYIHSPELNCPNIFWNTGNRSWH